MTERGRVGGQSTTTQTVQRCMTAASEGVWMAVQPDCWTSVKKLTAQFSSYNGECKVRTLVLSSLASCGGCRPEPSLAIRPPAASLGRKVPSQENGCSAGDRCLQLSRADTASLPSSETFICEVQAVV